MFRVLSIVAALALSVSIAQAAPRSQDLTKTTYKTATRAATCGGAYALSRAYKTPFHASDMMNVVKTKSLPNSSARYSMDDGNNFSAWVTVKKVKAGFKFDKHALYTRFGGIE